MMDGKWEDGQEINVKKFDDYYGDKAKIDGIHFQVIKDMETAYKEFQAGNLDVCDVPVAQIDAAKKDRGVSKDGYTMGDGERMLLGAEPSTYYLTCNTTAEPFSNADLRRGISLAINRWPSARPSSRVPVLLPTALFLRASMATRRAHGSSAPTMSTRLTSTSTRLLPLALTGIVALA